MRNGLVDEYMIFPQQFIATFEQSSMSAWSCQSLAHKARNRAVKKFQSAAAIDCYQNKKILITITLYLIRGYAVCAWA